MSLKLMYITNLPDVASIAQYCGVDRIFLDMEYIGKAERQPGDTVKSFHTVEDVSAVRAVIDKSELLVRVNPITDESDDFCGSEKEIDAVIRAGADIIMLPMAKTVDEVVRFSEYVSGRARKMLLIETAEAASLVDEILSLGIIDEVHIGLNDLHMSMGKRFMFELLTDGTVESLCKKISAYGIPYGFGGIARLGYGMLPAEYVICEHYRLGSNAAILSRSFANVNNITDMDEIARIFEVETARIRDYERLVSGFGVDEYNSNRLTTSELVTKICEGI